MKEHPALLSYDLSYDPALVNLMKPQPLYVPGRDSLCNGSINRLSTVSTVPPPPTVPHSRPNRIVAALAPTRLHSALFALLPHSCRYGRRNE